MNKSSLSGKQISREEAYKDLGDPSTWEADRIAARKEFFAKPIDVEAEKKLMDEIREDFKLGSI